MAFDLGSLFKKASITKKVTAGAGGSRDAYIQHVTDMTTAGQPALSWEDWLKQQQAQEK